MPSDAIFDFQMDGLGLLEKNLRLISRETERTILKKAVRKGAEVIRAAAEARAPVDEGDFKRSFVVSAKLKRSQRSASPPVEGARVYIGSTDPKAHLVEWGTDPHLIQTAGKKVLSGGGSVFGMAVSHPGTPAQPTLRPAFDATWKAALKVMAIDIAKSLERLAKRLQKQAAKGKLSKSGLRDLGLKR